MSEEKLVGRGRWEAAICYDAQTSAYSLRQVLEAEGMEFQRRRDHRLYQNYIGGVVPIPKYAYVYVFTIKDGGWEVWFYDKKPTHSGTLHMVEVRDITPENIGTIKRVMRAFARALPRRPWEFFWSERLRYALFAPEYVRAKRLWAQIGVE